MAKEEEDDNLPDKDAAKEFYAKYEPKEIIGRYISNFIYVVQSSLQNNYKVDLRFARLPSLSLYSKQLRV